MAATSRTPRTRSSWRTAWRRTSTRSGTRRAPGSGRRILPRAATLYAKYLREAPPDARDRDLAAVQLARLAPRLGCIEVHGSVIEQLSVDERPSEDRFIYVSPGAHVVRAVVAGALMQQTPEVSAGDVVALVFEPPPPSTLRRSRPARPGPGSPPRHLRGEAAAHRPGSWWAAGC